MTDLAHLQKVDLHAAWQTEAGHFTPWLAQESNLALLGKAINLELEFEAQEKNVGPFRADILCRDTLTENWVLIENQLEKTDHTHLGQLMTYAAGLRAVTIVWIAARFTEEHRAAIDWLNDITDTDFNFFGLEIELWRIGTSPPAAKFNVVSKPNDWSKTVHEQRDQIRQEDLTDRKQAQLEFWNAMNDRLTERGSFIVPQKPRPQTFMDFPIGRSYFLITALANWKKQRLAAWLALLGPDAKGHFHLLQEQKEQIETELQENVEWMDMPGKKQSRIRIRKPDFNPKDRDDWTRQHDWLIDKIEKLDKVFRGRVKELDVTQASIPKRVEESDQDASADDDLTETD